MAGYLDEYGVAEARRGRIVKRIALWTLLLVVVGTSGYFYLRNWSEERRVGSFIALLKDKKYQEAYTLWDSPETRRFYSAEKFIEDWGPSGNYKNPSGMKIQDVDSCAGGVVFNVAYPGTENFGLWVSRDTQVISFAPWPRCPGQHLQVMEFLRSRFGGEQRQAR